MTFQNKFAHRNEGERPSKGHFLSPVQGPTALPYILVEGICLRHGSSLKLLFNIGVYGRG